MPAPGDQRGDLLHGINLANGTYRQSKFLRWARSVAYALFTAAGTLLLLSSVFTPLLGATAALMSWFLVVGGAVSALGAILRRWVGEFVGLPLLISSFGVFAVITIQLSFQETPYIAVADAAILFGFALVLAVRWRAVLAIYRLAHRFSGSKEQQP